MTYENKFSTYFALINQEAVFQTDVGKQWKAVS